MVFICVYQIVSSIHMNINPYKGFLLRHKLTFNLTDLNKHMDQMTGFGFIYFCFEKTKQTAFRCIICYLFKMILEYL